MHSAELDRAETPKQICCALSSVQETEMFSKAHWSLRSGSKGSCELCEGSGGELPAQHGVLRRGGHYPCAGREDGSGGDVETGREQVRGWRQKGQVKSPLRSVIRVR